MAKYDIYKQYVRFQDDREKFKPRPVIEVGKRGDTRIAASLTGHVPRHNSMGEYAVQDWQEAGLRKPSTIRLSKCFPLWEGAEKIGRLTQKDIEGLNVKLKEKAEHDGPKALTDNLKK